MSDQDNLFDRGSQGSISTFDQLVGEGKKFKTAEDLAASKAHTDAHISTLESELKDIREELEKRDSIEDIVRKARQPVQEPKSSEPTSLDKEGVRSVFKEFQSEQKAASNIVQVDSKMREKFGEAAKKVTQEKASELGVSLDFMKHVASEDPRAFLAWFQNTPVPEGVQPTTSTEGVPQPTKDSPKTFREFMENARKDGRRTLNQQEREQLQQNELKFGHEAVYG